MSKLQPNEIVGTVIETESRYSRFGQIVKSMTVQWINGEQSSEIPMIVIAKPGDKFVFTIRPQ